MNAHFRVLFACGLLILPIQCLWAQSLTVGSGAVAGFAASSADSDRPKPGPVTGVPYSAVTETERSQTLADGTHINQKVSPEEKNFRDSLGRTRNERYQSLGLAGDAPSTLERVWIRDPVAGVEYFLYPQTHTACQGRQGGGFEYTYQGTSGACFYPPRAPGRVVLDKSRINPPNPSSPRVPMRPKPVVEDLGTQQMEGLTVYGTKTTTTIPAGALGNDRPMETVSESWFSKELNIYVLIKNSDPRNGENTIRTTNIDRSEPDPSLFQVPPGYTLMKPE
jgi:hypothetical protein